MTAPITDARLKELSPQVLDFYIEWHENRPGIMSDKIASALRELQAKRAAMKEAGKLLREGRARMVEPVNRYPTDIYTQIDAWLSLHGGEK